jgi:hypothetical protein
MEMIEFVECSSLSISFDATGKATISCSVIRNDNDTLTGDYDTWQIGGVSFDGDVMSLNQQPLQGSYGWNQWALQWEGVGN